jgi:hypothetical protein
MGDDTMDDLAVVGFMAVLANRLVELIVKPFFDKYELDKFPLMYIAWLVAGLLCAATQVNIFAEYVPNPVIGLVLTAIVAGGGANMLNDFPKRGVVNLIDLPDPGSDYALQVLQGTAPLESEHDGLAVGGVEIDAEDPYARR